MARWAPQLGQSSPVMSFIMHLGMYAQFSGLTKYSTMSMPSIATPTPMPNQKRLEQCFWPTSLERESADSLLREVGLELLILFCISGFYQLLDFLVEFGCVDEFLDSGQHAPAPVVAWNLGVVNLFLLEIVAAQIAVDAHPVLQRDNAEQ